MDKIVFYVSDDGRGMTTEELAKLKKRLKEDEEVTQESRLFFEKGMFFYKTTSLTFFAGITTVTFVPFPSRLSKKNSILFTIIRKKYSILSSRKSIELK